MNVSNAYASWSITITMESNNFYLTLLSNVQSVNSENTCAEFRTFLPERKRLTGKWAVGLAEISYTYSWYNLEAPAKPHFYKLIKTPDRQIVKEPIATSTAKVRPGHYSSIQDLIEEIEYVIKDHMRSLNFNVVNDTHPKVLLDRAEKRIAFIAGSQRTNDPKETPAVYDRIYFDFDQHLMSILGFFEGTREYREGRRQWVLKADVVYNIKAGIHCLAVYSDVALPVHIGDVYAPVLKIVPIPPSGTVFGDQINYRFDSPDYIPLIVNEFDNIKIDIRMDDGQLVPFNFGRSVVKLHFKKVDNE